MPLQFPFILDFPFGFGQKSSLLLIFFFHGMVFSALSLFNGVRYQNKSTKWLSLLLFLYAMYITPYMLGYAGWYGQKTTREILFFIPFMQVLLIGPIVYFYVKKLLSPNFKLEKKHWIHFLPAFVYAIYSFIIFIVDKLVLKDYYFYADGRDKDLANWYQVLGLISMGLYLILSLKHYKGYKKLIFETVSYADTILFKWIKNFLIAFLVLILLRILFFITNPEWGEFGSQFWYYISFSVVFYYISIHGYTTAIRSSIVTVFNPKSTSAFEDNQVETNSDFDPDSEPNMDLWKSKLLTLIDENQMYKNQTLTLFDVAKALNTTQKTISTVVNNGFQMNFNDFINHYRVKAVKEQLKNGEQNRKTLLGIALDCGFNSKATFNRAFKKSTQITPKEYIEKIT